LETHSLRITELELRLLEFILKFFQEDFTVLFVQLFAQTWILNLKAFPNESL
jgi:hypothetical protein